MIYLKIFKLSDKNLSCPNIYPYNVFKGNEGACFFFEPITVLYGNNGSGKSTLLNVISNKLGLKGSELATPNTFGNDNYCLRYNSECLAGLGEDEFGRTIRSIPRTSRYIKSEDILYEIKKIQQRPVLDNSMLMDLISSGESYSSAVEQMGSVAGWKKKQALEFSQEKYSNGETSLQYLKEFLVPDSLYLLDEPEVSLSPANQVDLSEMLNELARLLQCQFIVATHSPFMLGTLNAKIYDLDSKDYREARWSELDNVRYFYDFFKKHEDEFV